MELHRNHHQQNLHQQQQSAQSIVIRMHRCAAEEKSVEESIRNANLASVLHRVEAPLSKQDSG